MILGIDASRAARTKRTGTETYALELINALADLIPSNYHLRLYTPHPPQHNHWPEAANIETRVIPWPRLWTHLRLSAELWQHPPDVLFVPAHVLPLRCPVPAVVTVHDLGYHHYPEAHRSFARWYLDWTTRRHTRVAQHIIADSEATKQDLVTVYGAKPTQIEVVYLGRDERLALVQDQAKLVAVKRLYQIEGPYLLYLGTLHPRKNLVRLVTAFAQVLQQGAAPDLKLVIAGQQGWLYNEIYQQVQALGLNDRVILPGYVAAEDKAALLSGALAYVFPSLYEGFGLPVLEAMACGLPVLTSQTSSLPEVAGEAALLVDPHDVADIADKLQRLISDADLRQQLVERGQKQIKKFSWSQTAHQILQIMERVARTGKDRR